MDFHIKEELTEQDFRRLCGVVGWDHYADHVSNQMMKADLGNVALILSAVFNGETVGALRLINMGYAHYIETVCVHPDYQGQGIGTALVQYCADWIQTNVFPGGQKTIILIASAGRKDFYEEASNPD